MVRALQSKDRKHKESNAMSKPVISGSIFPTAKEDLGAAKLTPETPQTKSASYRLA